MTNPRVVVLRSRSLYIEGLRSLLNDHEGLELNSVDADQRNAMECIRSFCPEVVILDSWDATVTPNLTIPQILNENPGAKVISIDPTTFEMSIFYRQQVKAANLEELVEVIAAF